MVRFLWILFLGVILYWAVRELLGKGSKDDRKDVPGEEMVKDPQCGVYLPKSSAVSCRLNGKSLYFCSEECREKYKAST